MRTLKIPFPDIAYYEKTRLSTVEEDLVTIVSGSHLIYVRNPSGISVGNFLVLDAFESEDAEIVSVSSIDSTSHLIELSTGTLVDHAVGVPVMRTPYNKLRVYRGTSIDTSTHTEITSSPYESLRPDNAYTYYVDTSGWISSLTAEITNSADTIVVNNGADCPATPFTVFLDSEELYVSSRSGNTLTVTRGYNNTTAATHLKGASIFSHYYSYAYYNSSTTALSNRVLYEDLLYDSILTVQQLVDWFMFGLDLTDDDGYPFPNSMLEFAIRSEEHT